jgi:zinc transporter ZupT
MTLIATLVVSLVAVVGILLATLLVSLPQLKVHNILCYANAFAVGALLTVSLVHLVPEGLAGLERYGEGSGWRGMSVLLSAFFIGAYFCCCFLCV